MSFVSFSSENESLLASFFDSLGFLPRIILLPPVFVMFGRIPSFPFNLILLPDLEPLIRIILEEDEPPLFEDEPPPAPVIDPVPIRMPKRPPVPTPIPDDELPLFEEEPELLPPPVIPIDDDPPPAPVPALPLLPLVPTPIAICPPTELHA